MVPGPFLGHGAGCSGRRGAVLALPSEAVSQVQSIRFQSGARGLFSAGSVMNQLLPFGRRA
jgi:hypothetical protein